jgi:hypothetical protein
MPNITFAVDEMTLAHAKAFAAEHGTTLNKLVNSFLSGIQANRPRRAESEAQQVCLDYSLGNRSLTEAADALGLQDGGLFLALMRRTGLPLPRLGNDEIARQADASRDVFLETFGLDRKRTPRRVKPARPR